MATSFNPLRIRAHLRRRWMVVSQPAEFGPDGWEFIVRDPSRRSILITASDHPGSDVEWVHASIASPDEMPTYDDLVALHHAVFGEGFAYQCFVPSSQHVNIHEHALHLWGRLDGKPVLPEFGLVGSI